MEVLNTPTLVLNKSWIAVGTTTVKEAVILLMRGSAKVLETKNYLTYAWEDWLELSEENISVKYRIKTPNAEIPAPEVIILSHYDDVFRTTIQFSTRAVFRRDNYTCAYCNKRKKVEELSIDHIIPKSRKGGTNWLNCITSCFSCNNKKGDASLAEANMKLHFKPRVPKWSPVIHVRNDSRPESWKNLVKEDHWDNEPSS